MTKRIALISIVFLLVLGLMAVTPQRAFAGSKTTTPSGFACKKYVHVRTGDNLLKISQKYGVAPRTVIFLNDLKDPNLLMPDQKLCVQAAAKAGKFHVVASGDTLTRIANRYKMDVKALAEANDLENPDLIIAGQVLVIPKGKNR